MTTRLDVTNSINCAFPIFSHGECHIDEFLNRYSFDQDGIRQQWEMYNRLSSNVLEFLRARFPKLEDNVRSAICELQMSKIQDKIREIENKYQCECSIVNRYVPETTTRA
jgi:hypothetical protein